MVGGVEKSGLGGLDGLLPTTDARGAQAGAAAAGSVRMIMIVIMVK